MKIVVTVSVFHKKEVILSISLKSMGMAITNIIFKILTIEIVNRKIAVIKELLRFVALTESFCRSQLLLSLLSCSVNTARRFELGVGLTWRNLYRFSKVIQENKTAQCQDSGFLSIFGIKPKIKVIKGDQSR